MRILAMMIMTIFLSLGAASAATVNLNNGSSIQGDIIKQDAKSIQLNVDGVTMTYYADEIKDVDGQPLGSAQAAPAADATAPAPAAPADTTAAPAAQPDTTAAPAVQPDTTAAPAVQPDTTTAPAAQPDAAASGTIDPEKKALILKFIDVFGTRQALTNNFELMIQQIQKEKPEEAQKIRDRVKVDEIIERLLPIYDRNFTADDLKSFVDFYGSSAGQKLIKTIPELMKESVQESIKYMEEKFPEVKQGQQ